MLAGVPKNLHWALQEFRRFTMPSLCARSNKVPLLWVDGLCIDQDDEKEKSSQVNLMGSIYRSAFTTISWVGRDNGRISTAIKWLDLISRELSEPWGEYSPNGVMWMQKYPALFQDDRPVENEIWGCVMELFDLPYWTRVWIVQEIALARNVYVVCGAAAIDYLRFEEVAKWVAALSTNPDLQRPGFMGPNMWNFVAYHLASAVTGIMVASRCGQIAKAEEDQHDDKWNKWKCITSTVNHKATNPRDKIYALFGLFQTRSIADYRKPTEDVYYGFIEELFAETGSIEFVAFAGLRFRQESFDLPTWIPNWGELSHHEGSQFPVNVFHADRGLKDFELVEAFIGEHRILHASGTICGKIEKVQPWPLGGIKSFMEWCREYASVQNMRYIIGIPRLQAAFRLCLMDGDVYEQDRAYEEPYPDSTHRIVLGFLELMRECGETNRSEFYESLGIDAKHFAKSYSERIFGLTEVQGARIWARGDDWLPSAKFLVKRAITRNLCQTMIHMTDGYIGWGPTGTLPSDLVAVVNGCSLPLILRKVDSRYEVVGGCFLLGLMNGEVVQRMKERRDTLQELQLQ
ncbi:heterokaryon incompatibility protein-domain-containing protein [Nemania sp. FL0916]|nr:heterokaryon incompatibility protein-domain-containing protein [Nemania sp. FL0916]